MWPDKLAQSCIKKCDYLCSSRVLRLLLARKKQKYLRPSYLDALLTAGLGLRQTGPSLVLAKRFECQELVIYLQFSGAFFGVDEDLVD
jgi:hypothetical protein